RGVGRGGVCLRWRGACLRCSWLRWACDSFRLNTNARDALVRTPAGVASRRGLDRFFSLAPDSRAEAVRFLTLPCGNTLPEAPSPHARSLVSGPLTCGPLMSGPRAASQG